MLLKYGDYSHPAGETEVTISRETLFADVGVREGIRERWTVRGRLAGATPAALTTAVQALEAAHDQDQRDLVLYLADGVTSSAHTLTNSRTLTGVKVARLSYPDGRGAEYATFRTYEVVYEAERPAADSPGVISWIETLSVSGGGPRFEYITCVLGPPVRVQVAQQTPCRCTQTGSAVGYGTWPAFSTPLFPEFEHVDRRRQETITPQYTRGGRARFPIRWSYEFESPTPFFGVPNSY